MLQSNRKFEISRNVSTFKFLWYSLLHSHGLLNLLCDLCAIIGLFHNLTNIYNQTGKDFNQLPLRRPPFVKKCHAFTSLSKEAKSSNTNQRLLTPSSNFGISSSSIMKRGEVIASMCQISKNLNDLIVLKVMRSFLV